MLPLRQANAILPLDDETKEAQNDDSINHGPADAQAGSDSRLEALGTTMLCVQTNGELPKGVVGVAMGESRSIGAPQEMPSRGSQMTREQKLIRTLKWVNVQLSHVGDYGAISIIRAQIAKNLKTPLKRAVKPLETHPTEDKL